MLTTGSKSLRIWMGGLELGRGYNWRLLQIEGDYSREPAFETRYDCPNYRTQLGGELRRQSDHR